ncbi:MAG: hypothetical protein Q4E10_03750 [Porphyromonas sp.]|nr:hypothetical protein [Porphyromonas sp.]
MSNRYPPLTPDQLTPYGTIRKTHGHQGEIVVGLVDDSYLDLDPVFLFLVRDEIPVPYRVLDIRGTADRLIISLDGITDLSSAEETVGHALLIALSELPQSETPLPRTLTNFGIDRWELYHTDGAFIGQVVEVEESTSNRLLVVEQTDGTRVLIPFAEEWLTDIVPERHTLTLDFPLDLLEL